ncbi:DNA adenine methylase [Komagataeibacter swingsii]|nr:DNA adenine methylase [Komagataeibacter swingsii]
MRLMCSPVTRPLLRWHGGKWRIAPWITEHFPHHRCYVEAFGGAASVLLRKLRSGAEVYNDLDDDVVNLFRVLRNPAHADQLVRLLEMTPFARTEHDDCREHADCPVERARRMVVRSFMGFGSDSCRMDRRTGFRSSTNRDGGRSSPARDWANYPDALRAIIERVQSVVIEHRDAMEVMQIHDQPWTLHYVDPPYLPATRRMHAGHGYVHELSGKDHRKLLSALRGLKGMVVLSGYPHSSYDRMLRGWRSVSIQTYADGARPRTEMLWLNPATQSALAQQELPLHINKEKAA